MTVDLLAFIGTALVVGGFLAIWWPLALIAAGLACLALVYLVEAARVDH